MRNNDKDEDVMCWNCFTVDNVENDDEPITLKKVRIQQREKLKIYPFLASELSKPRTVDLKQKLSSHYHIGKKNIDKINKNNKLQSDLKAQEETDSQFNSNPIEKDENSFEDKFSESLLSESCDTEGNDEKYSKHKYLKNTIKIPVNTLLTNDNVLKNDTSNSTVHIIGPAIEPPESTSHKTHSTTIPLSTTRDKDTVYNNTEIAANKNTSRIPLKVKRLAADNSEKYLFDNESGTYNLGKSECTEYSKPEKGLDHIDSKNKSIEFKEAENASCSFYKNEEISKLRYQEHLGTQKEKASLENKIKTINFKVPICKNIEIPTAISDISHKIETIEETTEFQKDSSEKFEKISNTISESGYAGSSGTIKDLDNDNTGTNLQLRTKSVEDIEPQKHVHGKNVFTSLTSLNKSTITASKPLSLSLDNDNGDLSSTITSSKKPIKSLRWSTLSMPPRKFSFEDDIYISETSTPHHATLPRRSNSPLPHDRDFDRERYHINRSGLQARSESMASVYSGAGEAMRGSVTVRGEVQFSLLYNYRLGALEVGVKRCRDLAPVDVKRNRSDPYVKVYLLPDKSKAGKRKTKVKKNTLSPVFEETLSFVQPLASLSARTLWLSAWHADIFGRNDFLGEVTLPLADVVFDDPAPQWYKLHERTEQFDEHQGTRGDLIIGLKFELQESARGKGTLHVLIKEAKNLVATKPNGLTDVFCKSYLLPERGRLAKQKTGVMRRTLNPRWEHTFTYRGLSLAELRARALELSLWDRDRLASNDFMGAVRLSLGTGTYMGAGVNWMDSIGKEVTLWQTMMERPNFWVEGSLPLRPQLNN